MAVNCQLLTLKAPTITAGAFKLFILLNQNLSQDQA